MKPQFLCAIALVAVTSCVTDESGAEKGPHNTIAYNIRIESSEPNTKIEVNYQAAGIAPLTVKVFGDRDGTFHNFGGDEWTVRAYPPRADAFPQTKIFKTGTMGVKDDKIPERVFFDFSGDKSAK